MRFNAVVSPHRVFETRRFGLDEFERIASLVRGATVHDAVLAVCGGALRRYLAAHDELPPHSLFALTPSPEAEPAAARRPWRRVALATDVDDPVQRLRRIRAQALGATAGHSVGDAAQGSTVLARTAKVVARALAGERSPLAACSITHVPGPPGPLYLCGARMSYYSAMLPISDGLGLAFAVTSYDGRVIISPTSCRELMPDPEAFAQALRDSFQELLALAPPAAAVKPLRPVRRSAPRAPRAAAGRR